MLALSPVKTKSDPATFPGEPEVAADIAEALLEDAADDVKLLKIASAILPALPVSLTEEQRADIAEGVARMVLDEPG